MTLTQVSSSKVFAGLHQQFTHVSAVNNCTMKFAIYLPPQVQQGQTVPVLYWLSGLTCTDENFMQKAGAFKLAAELGIAIVAPDTSPRGENVPDDTEQSYDLGLGAGFYLNATESPWQTYYNMYDYIVNELPEIIQNNFPVNKQQGISGHSMGGHGALTIGLKNPEKYSSISAFSPICNPTKCPWGIKAFTAYLGDNPTLWLEYDATELIKRNIADSNKLPILISQGDSDNFLAEQLMPDNLIAAAEQNNYPLTYCLEVGYDHSYFFISSFIEQHLRFFNSNLTSK
ncbi:S-formylglutathione hydrolase [Catenovulum maritimum]|uniref:S-formylglutathione hydrolase n=1 Tax=Catenovulum maritimum TaxID=1513271 RepID=A0A0J8GRJ6_9ALTE|nr:S-formylglutathione hydrolase [Catenovulum maritimum]KMT65332.1 S-formylglutathione hydrolase [Catenovulum maritimum]